VRLLLVITSICYGLIIAPVSAEKKSAIPTEQPAAIIPQIYQLVDDRVLDIPLFIRALKHPDRKVRVSALTGLARIGGEPVVALVAPFLTHAEPETRQLAAFALGLSGAAKSSSYLWKRVAVEQNLSVKHELYLALANLGGDGLITAMLQRLNREPAKVTQASIFQAMGIALTFHRELKLDYDSIDFDTLISHFSRGDDLAVRAGFFLDRIPNIANSLKASQLLSLSKRPLSPLASIYLSRLIGKVSGQDKTHNRALLAWLIAQSESDNLNLQIEAVRAMKNMFDFPQALIQLGKMQASSQPLLAQTALKVIADSSENSADILALLKAQLKNKNDALVVEAISGLSQRQNKADMNWVVKLFAHPSAYVKIKLIQILKNKSIKNGTPTEFDMVIRFLTNDPVKAVGQYAKRVLENNTVSVETVATSPEFSEVSRLAGTQLQINTSAGAFTIELLGDAPYTGWHFFNNARLGVYDGSYFSRVIGNFIAQGGDTIGDGSGSSERTIREEINLLVHQPLSVAMATAGKDTGTSQFFINTTRNFHLDRHYTVFARVVIGKNNVYQLSNGVRILSVVPLEK